MSVSSVECNNCEFTTKSDEDSRLSTECYVFVDYSYLWVSGQKAHSKKLLDANTDSRFRVDLGRFLQLVTRGSIISKAFLYGSTPAPMDSVWGAARNRNFTVNIFQRTKLGKVKEIHRVMAHDITKTMHTADKGNAIYIIVSGDRNLRPIIGEVLDNGMQVDLWSWEDAMAQEFRQLAKFNPLFTANYLDSVQERFSFTAYMSNRRRTDVDPAHAIVYRDVLAGADFKYLLADHMHRLLRLFYITTIESHVPGRRDYIIEFPNSNPEVILQELQHDKFQYFEYQPCSYPEYRKTYRASKPIQLTTNRFAPLVYDDFESLPDTATMTHMATDSDYDTDDRFTEVRRKLGGKTAYTKKTLCQWGDHCHNASKCPYLHTDEEKELFARLQYTDFRYFKTKECNRKEEHVTVKQRKWCAFAHDNEDSWCLSCKMYGHLTDNCQVQVYR